MKKGFTIVELIICIFLLGLIGTSVAIISIKTNHKKEEKVANEINDKILEASKLYLYVEKDDLGNTYQEGIFAGGRGVQISVQNLIDRGYIEEEYVKTLEQNPNDMYIVASLSTSNGMRDNCETGTLQFERSWITPSTEPIYLCAYNGKVKEDNSLYNTIKSNRTCLAYDFQKKGSCNIDDNNYFYTGNIDNNYVKFQNTNTLFRIVKTESKTDNSGYYIKLAAYERISANPPGATENGNYWWYESSLEYLYDTSHYDYFSFSASWNADGTISLTTSPHIHYGDCPAQTYTYDGWTDSTIKSHIGCTGREHNWKGKVIKNPYYELIYNPLNNWFLSLDDKIKNIALEYNYCIKEDGCDNYYITSKFATLSKQDYDNILSLTRNDRGDLIDAYIWDQQIPLDGFDINEIVFSSLASGIKRVASSGKWWNSRYNNIHLRPTIMIDGNIKVISGVGTDTDPYILET